MTGTGGRLQVDAPEDMYTMPPQRINHFISDEHLAIIESGGRDRFFDYHLAFAGATLGFLQNATIVATDMFNGTAPTRWDIFCSVLFGGFLAAAICFRVASSTKDDPVKLVVADIKKRQAKPFLASSELASDEFLTSEAATSSAFRSSWSPPSRESYRNFLEQREASLKRTEGDKRR